MADANLLSNLNEDQSVTTSMILDTLMYTDGLSSTYEQMTVKEIIFTMQYRDLKGEDAKAALKNIRDYYTANENADVWNYKMHSCSTEYGGQEYKGACGATFYKGGDRPEGCNSYGEINPSDVYVAFRGTGEGRWYDNGDAFAKESSDCQDAAVSYFDQVVKDMRIDSSCNVLSTGHSKGGNEAQFIAIGSKNGYLIDKVISIDGQGMSQEAIDYYEKLLGKEAFEAQCQKMYSICGDNDYVNVLGKKIIPEDHTVYIETKNDGFANAHALFDKKNGGNLFDYKNGNFFPTTDKQKEIALFAAAMSASIMPRSKEERASICHTVMSLMECLLPADEDVQEYKTGMINNETFKFKEVLGFLRALPSILADSKTEGKALIKSAMENFLGKLKNVNPGELLGNFAVSAVTAIREKGIPAAMNFLDSAGEWISEKAQQGADAVKQFGRDALNAGKEFCRGVKDTFNKARDFITGKSGNNHHSHGGGLADSPRGGHGGGGGSPSFFGNNGSLLNLFANQNSDDLIIDEDAINKAVEAFADLSKQLQDLRHDIEEMLATLKIGFDTPAGRKFIKSCENNLITPLERQRLVIEHISQNLQDVKTNYYSVFDGYRDLINKINSYQS